MTRRVVSIHRDHTLSGVSTAGLHAASLPSPHTPWTPLIVGGDLPPDTIRRTPFADLRHARAASWPRHADAAERALALADALEDLDPGVVVPNDHPAGFVAAALLPRAASAAWCHGDDPLSLELYERCLPLTHAAAAVNRTIRRRIEPLAPYTLDEPVPAGLPVPPAPPPWHDTRTLRLLYLGWLDRRNKRCTDLAPLARRLESLGVPFLLRIAGDGPCADALAHDLGPLRNTRALMLGRLTPHQARDEIRNAHALVLTSASEGWPMAVMEAAALGRTSALTTGSGGAADDLTHGVNALVAPTARPDLLADAFAHTHADPAAWQRLGEAAHRFARDRLDLPHLARRLARLTDAAAERAASTTADPARRWTALRLALGLIGPCSPGNLRRLAERFARAHAIAPDQLDLDPRPPHYLSPPERRLLDARRRLATRGLRRVALYGGGRHSARLANALPGIFAIIDDQAHDHPGLPASPIADHLGIPVIHPDDAAPLRLDAIIISSDEHEHELLRRAQTWAGPTPVLTLYADPPAATTPAEPAVPRLAA
ncbi:MAG: glycosyltransferase [Phycisphaeraceae bacterium]|nr:MAG: glycosyltransferase [Phycisphaeraceae bacterium]